MQPGSNESLTLSPEQKARVNTLVDELLDLPREKRGATAANQSSTAAATALSSIDMRLKAAP